MKILETQDVNESYIKVLTNDMEDKITITNFLSAYTDGYRFTPQFKAGIWDGKKNFYKLAYDGILVPKGLIFHLIKAMKKNQIDIKYIDKSEYLKITLEEFNKFVETLNLPFPPYDYQLDTCVTFINKGRITAQLATGAGKSLIIYMLSMYFKMLNKKSLIIVPNVTLVNQIRSDFNDYNYQDHDDIHIIFAGQEKHLDCNITISTWQSLYQNTEILTDVDVVIVDEAHQAKSTVFDDLILPKLINCKYRLGLSGTIVDLSFADRMSLIGSLGPNVKIINAQGLISRGLGTPIEIKCLFFNYNKEEKKMYSKLKYPKEVEIIEGHYKRNLMLAKMTNKIAKTGNTILLFNKINHGKWLMELLLQVKFGIEDLTFLESTTPNNIKKLIKDNTFPLKIFTNMNLDDKQISSIQKTLVKNNLPASYIDRFESLEQYDIYMIYGAIEAKERERIRKLLETKSNAILLGNYQVLSTGVNIRNLHNIIMGAPNKSPVRLRQTIGRGIRLHSSKSVTKIWDVTDDFSSKTKSGKTVNKNHTLSHFESRLLVYQDDGFPLSEVEIQIS